MTITQTTSPDLARARRAALLSDLNRSELTQLGRILASALRHTANRAGFHAAIGGPDLDLVWAADRDGTAAELQDVLTDDVLGMLLHD